MLLLVVIQASIRHARSCLFDGRLPMNFPAATGEVSLQQLRARGAGSETAMAGLLRVDWQGL